MIPPTIQNRRRHRLLCVDELEPRRMLASIEGFVYHDFNGNGIRDAAEPAQSNVSVFLNLDGDGEHDEDEPIAVSDGNGRYQFSGLPGGNYGVQVIETNTISHVSPSRRSGISTLVDVNQRDFVYDPLRKLVYATTSRSTIERFDPIAKDFLDPIIVGSSVDKIEITVDGRFLFVSGPVDNGVATIFKIDLADASIATISFEFLEGEYLIGDMAATASGKLIVIPTGYYNRDFVSLREIDVFTHEITVNSERPQIGNYSIVDRNVDGTKLIFGDQVDPDGAFYLYDGVNRTFVVERQTEADLGYVNMAVNGDGSIVALQAYHFPLEIVDSSLEKVFSGFHQYHSGGVVMDPIRDVLYSVQVFENDIYGFDARTGQQLFSFDASQNLDKGSSTLHISPDGRYLFVGAGQRLRMYEMALPQHRSVSVLFHEIATDVNLGIAQFEWAAIATDDTVSIQTNSNGNLIEVLNNDLGDIDRANVISVTSSTVGAAVSIINDALRYDPPVGFVGIDQLHYTIEDGEGYHTTASLTVTVRELNGLGDIKGFVWSDTNRNRQFDPALGEVALAGQTMYLDTNGNRQRDPEEPTQVTGADGNYSFLDVAPGSYQVRQELGLLQRATFPPLGDFDRQVIASGRDQVFDPIRGILYIAQSTGMLQRYDALRREMLEPWKITETLLAIDIDPGGAYLYAADGTEGATSGLMWKIDTRTGAKESIPYRQLPSEAEMVDLAVSASGRVFFTTDANGTGSRLQLREIDPVTREVIWREDFDYISEQTRLTRSHDYSKILFTNERESILYDADQDVFRSKSQDFLTIPRAAVSRTGDYVVVGRELYDDRFQLITTLPLLDYRGHAIFDPFREIIYFVSDGDVVAYDFLGEVELFRIPLEGATSIYGGGLSISSDGMFLSAATSAGLEVFHLGAVGIHAVEVVPNSINESIDFAATELALPPATVNDQFVVSVNANRYSLDVLANDSLLHAGPVSISHVTDPTNGGTVEIDGNQLRYTPALGYRGVDAFRYTVSNQHGQYRESLVTVTVRPNNGLGDLFGLAWSDRDSDGIFEPSQGETPLSGHKVYLDFNLNEKHDSNEPSRTTGVDGRYEFLDLAPAEYHVRQVTTTGFTGTFPVIAAEQNELIPIDDYDDMLFDWHRGMLYIGTDSGLLHRYDLIEQQLLEPWIVGNDLNGMDTTIDGRYLYVGEGGGNGYLGWIRKVDLDTGEMQTLTYTNDAESRVGGLRDVAVTTHGHAIFTPGGGPRGDFLGELDLATDTIVPTHSLRNGSQIHRSGDRSKMFLIEAVYGRGIIFDPATKEFLVGRSLDSSAAIANYASNRDGTRFLAHRSVMDVDLMAVSFLPATFDAALAFDWQRDVIYGVESTTDEVVAVNSSSLEELYRIAIGEDVDGRMDMIGSDGGRFLALESEGGIRLFSTGLEGSHTVSVGANSITYDLDFGQGQSWVSPRANDDEFTVVPDSASRSLSVLLNDDTFGSGDISITNVSKPNGGGTVTIADDQLIYQPLAGFRGVDRFRYQITNPQGQYRTAEVSVHVNPVDGFGEIQGTLWNDLDRNAVHDPGEPVISDREVYIDLNNDGLLDQGEPIAATNAEGQYRFEDVPPGSYQVREQVTDPWLQTYPTAPNQVDTLITSSVTDQVYDPHRNLLYMASGSQIKRYDLAAGMLLSPLPVGGSISSIDVTPDGAFLYAGDSIVSGGRGAIRRLDLDSGEVVTYRYDNVYREQGVYHVATTSTGTVFFTTETAGSGNTPLRFLEVGTGVIRERVLNHNESKVSRSRDHQLLIFVSSGSSGGSVVVYNARTDAFSSVDLRRYLTHASSNVNSDGSLFAVDDFVLRSSDLRIVAMYPRVKGGLAFDPHRDLLYLVTAADDAVFAYDIATGLERFRIPIGENLYQNINHLLVSDDGKHLFLRTHNGTVREFKIADATGHTVTVEADRISDQNAFGAFNTMAARIVSRSLFYNNSTFDGDPAASPNDDAGIAPDKVALLPAQGPATFANYTSTSQGITGIMIDVRNLPTVVPLDPSRDFDFRVGNSDDPATWNILSGDQLPAVSVREGDGALGSDRITLIWPEGTVVGQWLQVKVNPGEVTGLTIADIFYFGNAPGEVSGGEDGHARVDAVDFAMVRANPANFLEPATVRNPYDLNRDGLVNAADLLIVRDNATVIENQLRLIMPQHVDILFAMPDSANAFFMPTHSRKHEQHLAVAAHDDRLVADSSWGDDRSIELAMNQLLEAMVTSTVANDIAGSVAKSRKPGRFSSHPEFDALVSLSQQRALDCLGSGRLNAPHKM